MVQSTHAADTEYLVRKSMGVGYRMLSLLTPPLYTVFVISRRGRGALSLNNLLHATWIGGAVGCAGGGTFEYLRSANSSDDTVRARRIQTAYDTALIRADDHATIGALLFALLTPAIFWKRARVMHLLLGGAGIGSAIGLCTHFGRTLSGDPPPKVATPNLLPPS